MEGRDAEGHFTEEFKRWAVTELETGRSASTELSKRYGIGGHSTILKWCRRYGGNQYPFMKKAKPTGVQIGKNDQVLLLQNQVKVLERDLREARLKQATVETLIDIAERHHSICIKKNTGGKQSI